MAKRLSIRTESPAIRAAASMRHRDFQRECILRGLEFEKVVELDHPALVQWFVDHYDNSQSFARLAEFDAFVDQQLIDRGFKKGDALLHPNLKFGFIPTTSNSSPLIPSNGSAPIKIPKVEKSPKVKDDNGLVSGTKKSLTYSLVKAGKSTAEIIKEVTEKFPEAKESSIKIWISRVKKGSNV